eukprot:g24497.t1
MKDFIDQGGLQKYPAYGALQMLGRKDGRVQVGQVRPTPERRTRCRRDIADYAAVAPEQVLFVNGSDQGIDLVVRCCCPFGSEVIIPSPTFAMFELLGSVERAASRNDRDPRGQKRPLLEPWG